MSHRADSEQEAVLGGNERHVVIVAPPGTGKTALAARLAAREASHVREHERVLVLTFSNQARGQLEREVRRTVAVSERRRVVVTNYHSYFWSAVRAYRRALGLPDELRMSSWRRRKAILRGADARAVELFRTRQHILESFADQAYPEIAIPTGLDDERVQLLLVAVHAEHARGNLVFDDLGALYWTLITRFPSVGEAFRERYPIVIADEHQDASLLQDALVRDLGRQRRVILADPMQLIHGWRGADEARLQAHRDECEHEYTLVMPHRWHDEPSSGTWLLGVRRRLQGEPDPTPAPAGARLVLTDPAFADNGMLAATRYAVLEFLRSGCRSVAVLARAGEDVVRVRNHLAAHGLRPRQLGASTVFENGLALAEDLPALEGRALVDRAVDAVLNFLPTVPSAVRHQVRGRLGESGSRIAGCGHEAGTVLRAMDAIYLNGAPSFFDAVVSACKELRDAGHHLPCPDEYALYEAASNSPVDDLDEQLRLFNRGLAALSRRSQQNERGVMTMTIHQSKGREFDGVILFGATARWFAATDEDRRTFYVAITRGVRRWVVIAPRGSESELVGTLNSA